MATTNHKKETLNAESLITDHLDIWTSAIEQKSSAGRGSSKKFSLHGIKKLRELILELAVRGKLVPQDPNDEPVSVLLERIAAEKAQLLQEGKIKKPKILPEISEKEKPFELPNSWEFVRFGDVTFNRDGERKPVSADERKGIQGQYDYYGASGVIDQVNDYIFDQSLLLIGEDGANLVSRSTPIAFLAHGKYWVNNHAHVLDGVTVNFLEFIALHINAISLESYITGTAQPKMNQAKMNSIVLAIPPEDEQHRIVAKVDELMSLCDALEAQTESSLTAHQTLVETLLNALLKPDNHQEAKHQETFQQSWQRISEHFDTLFTTNASIDTLKQTILQLAVMGKLVPQNPSDEPAEKLLERIAAEKAQLIKDKKIKKQKPLPDISDEEKPFQLPKGWEFVRLGDLTSRLGSGSTPRGGQSAYVANGIIFLRSQNVWSDGLKLDDTAYISNETHEKMLNTHVYPNDVLLNITGASLGRCTIFPEKYSTANVSQHVTVIRLIEPKMNKFLHLGIISPLVQSLVWGRQVGMAIEGLSKKVLEQFEFPVPPLEEQHRIVAKVDQLMALCDQLKTRLTDAQTTQVQLADGIVEQAL